MNTIQHIQDNDFEEVVVAHNNQLDVTAIIAIHSTALGPSVGGTRMRHTASIDEATREVKGLARAMSYKASLANLRFGGGKAFIVPPKDLDPHDETDSRRRAIFVWFGEVVAQLGGRYVTTVDSGTFPADMTSIRESTDFVLGQPVASGGSGDPSPKTARGVRRSIEAISRAVLKKAPSDLIVNVQGAGHVGTYLIQELLDIGATVRVADIRDSARTAIEEAFGDRVIHLAVDDITKIPADIFAPCALGGVIHTGNAADVPFSAIVGAANNQLAGPATFRTLHQRGVYAVPDFVANAGGLMAVCGEYLGMPETDVWRRVDAIAEVVDTIATHHSADMWAPYDIAVAWADSHIAQTPQHNSVVSSVPMRGMGRTDIAV